MYGSYRCTLDTVVNGDDGVYCKLNTHCVFKINRQSECLADLRQKAVNYR